MFSSFFPRPKWFFLSAVVWIAIAVGLWYGVARDFGAVVGMPPIDPNKPPIVGIQMFWSPAFLWFYLYYAACTAIIAAFWQVVAPHPWWKWSILGSSFIIFNTFIDVQVSVATNNWRGPFFDMVQGAFAKTAPITAAQYYRPMIDLSLIFLVSIVISAFSLFYVSHWVFRWRTAMNDFYIERWARLRNIEGAAQRVQEDTMRFANITETLGVALVTSVMTLIAFLPVLYKLSVHVPELPIVGAVPSSLVTVAFVWAILGTVWLAAIGVKLPGLNFKNQRVEAAYRKELVFGEDHAERADPITLRELYGNVTKNYYRLYFHYLYFNVGRYFYLQLNSLLVMFLIGPAIVAGRITMGIWQQILTAFDQVGSSFLYLVNSWTTIVELISIYKRLQAFEATLDDKPVDIIEAQPAV